MGATRFDVLIVGSGPAGSIAALVLARGGARVALLDKARFPRDKACGDLLGPRGVQVLADLGIPAPGGVDVGDMLVVGPTGRRVRLPSSEGRTFPGYGTAITRSVLDASLHQAAVDAGAHPVYGRASSPLDQDGTLNGFTTDRGDVLRADIVIGADGATSRVAACAGLVQSEAVLWGFAVRTYLQQVVELPTIVLWEDAPREAFPGYGWIFPGPDGRANLGLGIGTLADRRAGARAVRSLSAFEGHLATLGLVTGGGAPEAPERLGGWLKMGMIGTTPAAGPVLLVGDAAGLVNPLQGEGIAQAMGSGRAAADAVLAGPGQAAERYRLALARAHLPFQRITAAAQAALVPRPRALAGVQRLLTLPVLSTALAPGWAVFWNALVDGAPPSGARTVAAGATAVGRAVTARTSAARWFDAAFDGRTRAPWRRQVAGGVQTGCR